MALIDERLNEILRRFEEAVALHEQAQAPQVIEEPAVVPPPAPAQPPAQVAKVSTQAVKAAQPQASGGRFHKLGPDDLVQGILMAEILGPPLALRRRGRRPH